MFAAAVAAAVVILKSKNLVLLHKKERKGGKKKPIRNLMSFVSFYFSPLLALYIIRREKELIYISFKEPALWHIGRRH